MRVEKFVITKKQKLSEAICEKYSFASYNFVQKLLRNHDVKVDGKRVAKDISVIPPNLVEFYYVETKKQIELFYEDNNIIVAVKPRQLETSSKDSDKNDTLQSWLEDQLKTKLFAVHRLDRNTEGLVIFAKTEEAKNSLENAIKNHRIKKYYLALVFGKFYKQSSKCVAYLKKDAEKSFAYISGTKKAGYTKIETEFKLLKHTNDMSLLEVLLVTGKTHQIRAHLAYLGYPIVGDEKYGNSLLNKREKKRFQCLCAYKLQFCFENNDNLEYLNQKNFELSKSKIEFCKNL